MDHDRGPVTLLKAGLPVASGVFATLLLALWTIADTSFVVGLVAAAAVAGIVAVVVGAAREESR